MADGSVVSGSVVGGSVVGGCMYVLCVCVGSSEYVCWLVLVCPTTYFQ